MADNLLVVFLECWRVGDRKHRDEGERGGTERATGTTENEKHLRCRGYGRARGEKSEARRHVRSEKASVEVLRCEESLTEHYSSLTLCGVCDCSQTCLSPSLLLLRRLASYYLLVRVFPKLGHARALRTRVRLSLSLSLSLDVPLVSRLASLSSPPALAPVLVRHLTSLASSPSRVSPPSRVLATIHAGAESAY